MKMYKLTKKGMDACTKYISELERRRKEILDSGLDTANDTMIPTVEDIQCDISFMGVDNENCYFNSWGITDNFNYNKPIILKFGEDFVEVE